MRPAERKALAVVGAALAALAGVLAVGTALITAWMRGVWQAVAP